MVLLVVVIDLKQAQALINLRQSLSSFYYRYVNCNYLNRNLLSLRRRNFKDLSDRNGDDDENATWNGNSTQQM